MALEEWLHFRRTKFTPGEFEILNNQNFQPNAVGQNSHRNRGSYEKCGIWNRRPMFQQTRIINQFYLLHQIFAKAMAIVFSENGR